MGRVKQVAMTWRRDLVFEGAAEGRPALVIDADGKTAPGPMDALLLALAACTGSDVVSILEKMKYPVRAMRLELQGERREEHPRRYTSIVITYRIDAPGVPEERARHAIELSLEKYCSVTHSLAPDIARRYELVLAA
jgi:putative redox protein